jgi:predicted RNA-binding protein with PIN domain
MDGHNMIFAIPSLQRLQVTDRREEARSSLADSLERFALARNETVHVVFDGNELPSNPEALRKPLFETVYTRRGEEVADDRILREARRCLERGLVVTVVTDDVRTLARELPRGVRRVGVREFWLKHIEREARQGGKRIEGDFSDVERDMLAHAALAEAAPEPRDPAPGSRPPAAAEESVRERIRRKREKGRQRQKRRLERRASSGRRR